MGIVFFNTKTLDEYRIHVSGLESIIEVMSEVGLTKEANILLNQQQQLNRKGVKQIYKKLKPYATRILYYTNVISFNTKRCKYCGTTLTVKECPACGKLYDTADLSNKVDKEPVYLQEFINFVKDVDSMILN